MDAATVAGRIILTNPRARRWAAWPPRSPPV